MITLKDFLSLDFSICGLDIDLRQEDLKLIERHVIGLDSRAAAHAKYIDTINGVDIYEESGFKAYYHRKPLNFHQTSEPFRGTCRPWGVQIDAIPDDFLKMQVHTIRPFAVSFTRHSDGSYYSLWLIGSDSASYKQDTSKSNPAEKSDNVTFDDILEANNE